MRIVAGRIVTVGSWYLGIVWLLFLNKKIKIVKTTYKKYKKRMELKLCLMVVYKIK
jgi:hypothetical protein